MIGSPVLIGGGWAAAVGRVTPRAVSVGLALLAAVFVILAVLGATIPGFVVGLWLLAVPCWATYAGVSSEDRRPMLALVFGAVGVRLAIAAAIFAFFVPTIFDVFDDARIETFRRLGYTYERLLKDGCAAVIRRIEGEFYAPARMDDLLSIHVHVEKVSSATMTLRYECRRDGQLLALALAVFAFLDMQGKPTRVPPDLRQVVLDHEGLLSGAT